MDLDHEILKPEETRNLLRQAQQGNSSARDTVVTSNQRLIMGIALRYFHCGYGGDQQLDDLVQWGNIGLLRAIEKYDPARSEQFNTYAVHWIKFYIRRFGPKDGSQFTMSFRDIDRAGSVRRARSRLMQKQQGEPTSADIARELNLKERDVDYVLPTLSASVRLDKQWVIAADGSDYSNGLHDIILDPDGENELREAEDRVVIASLRAAVKNLPTPIDQVIERYYFCDPSKTFDEIGRDLGFTKAYAQQCAHRGVYLLREAVMGRDHSTRPAGI